MAGWVTRAAIKMKGALAMALAAVLAGTDAWLPGQLPARAPHLGCLAGRAPQLLVGQAPPLHASLRQLAKTGKESIC